MASRQSWRFDLLVWCAAAVAQNKKTTANSAANATNGDYTREHKPGNAQSRHARSFRIRGACSPSHRYAGNDIEHMTQVQFRALPDTAMLRYRGQSLTKANFMQQRLKELMQRQGGQCAAKGVAVSFEIAQSPISSKSRYAELARKNGQAQAVIDALNNRTKADRVVGLLFGPREGSC